jgi:predicted membrane protein
MFQDIVNAPSVGVAPNLVVNYIAALLIDQMKKSKAPAFAWVNEHASGSVRMLSVIFATLQAAGFTFLWDAGNHALTLGGLKVENGVQFFWLLAQNYVFQDVLAKVMKAAQTKTSGQTVIVDAEPVAAVVQGSVTTYPKEEK